MSYCSNCGKEVTNDADVCLNCGCLVKNVNVAKDDKGGFGWGLLGFFVPIAGLILWLMWKDSMPKTAKSAGIGALASAIAGAVLFVLYIILIIVMVSFSISASIY